MGRLAELWSELVGSPKADKEGAMKTVFVSRRLERGAALVLVVLATFMVGATIGAHLRTTPEEPQEISGLYIRLAWLSKSLDKMEVELLELDQILTKNWAIRLENRMRLQQEVSDLSREYAEAAGNYNRSMRESGYRFADPAKLPLEAEFGPLPMRYEPFILLKGGLRA